MQANSSNQHTAIHGNLSTSKTQDIPSYENDSAPGTGRGKDFYLQIAKELFREHNHRLLRGTAELWNRFVIEIWQR